MENYTAFKEIGSIQFTKEGNTMIIKSLTGALLFTAAIVLFAREASADTVFPDDVIIQGSECVGFDCVNGESFGFDTIRLKENNTRIKFMDTSVSPFPTMDWLLSANDSASGGRNAFFISDEAREILTLVSGAPNYSVYVSSTGRVGFRTNTPVLDLHVNTGDTPAMRLEQNNGGGFGAQTWDIGANEANFFIRDVTSGSRLPFRIRPGAPTSSIDISADGDVGLGDASPNAKLHVSGGDATLRLSSTELNDTLKFGVVTVGHYTNAEEPVTGMYMTAQPTFQTVRIGGGSTAYNAVTQILFYTGATTTTLTGTERMRVDQNGDVMIARSTIAAGNQFQIGTDATNGNGAALTNAGIWTNGSSRLNKINIASLDGARATATLMDLQPVTYNGKQDSAETYVGFIAEDVPDLVAMNDRKGIAAIEITAVLTKVVQEQEQTIEAQQASLAELEARLARLEQKLATRN